MVQLRQIKQKENRYTILRIHALKIDPTNQSKCPIGTKKIQTTSEVRNTKQSIYNPVNSRSKSMKINRSTHAANTDKNQIDKARNIKSIHNPAISCVQNQFKQIGQNQMVNAKVV